MQALDELLTTRLDDLASLIYAIDVNGAQLGKLDDRDFILSRIDQLPDGLASVNSLVIGALRAWLVEGGWRVVPAAVGAVERGGGHEAAERLHHLEMSLANVLREQGHHGDAEPMFRRALLLNEERFGPSHPNTLRSMDELASLLKAQAPHPLHPLHPLQPSQPLRTLQRCGRWMGWPRCSRFRCSRLMRDGIISSMRATLHTLLTLHTLHMLHTLHTLHALHTFTHVTYVTHCTRVTHAAHAAHAARASTRLPRHPRHPRHPGQNCRGRAPLSTRLECAGRNAGRRARGDLSLGERPGRGAAGAGQAGRGRALLQPLQAEPLYRRKLQRQQTQQGKGHKHTLGTANNLASLLSEQV